MNYALLLLPSILSLHMILHTSFLENNDFERAEFFYENGFVSNPFSIVI